MKELVVLAIGGNSLITDEKHRTVEDQYIACAESCLHIVDIVEKGYNVVITHGNGPQVGFIYRRGELARHELHMVPLDSCGADTQGAIGYQIQKALYNELKKRGINRKAATIITQTIVDRQDPSFQKPSKPIGTFMSQEDAVKHQKEDGWSVVEDAGRGWRRVVPSPLPKEIIEFDAIKTLLDNDIIVVSVGGGGIPVMIDEKGNLTGVEAVIDKDFATALLAEKLNADILFISTAIDKVYINFKKPNQIALDKLTVTEAEKYIAEGQFAPGSMLPKIKAAIQFVKASGKPAIIADPGNIRKALDGTGGTWIVP